MCLILFLYTFFKSLAFINGDYEKKMLGTVASSLQRNSNKRAVKFQLLIKVKKPKKIISKFLVNQCHAQALESDHLCPNFGPANFKGSWASY